MARKQTELTVIAKAKDLAGYVLTVTDKSPKRFRFTLVAKLQGYALDVIEGLYRANEVFVSEGDVEAAGRRLDYQHRAITGMKLLGYMAQLAMEKSCILPKQYEQIAETPRLPQPLRCVDQRGPKVAVRGAVRIPAIPGRSPHCPPPATTTRRR